MKASWNFIQSIHVLNDCKIILFVFLCLKVAHTNGNMLSEMNSLSINKTQKGKLSFFVLLVHWIHSEGHDLQLKGTWRPETYSENTNEAHLMS